MERTRNIRIIYITAFAALLTALALLLMPCTAYAEEADPEAEPTDFPQFEEAVVTGDSVNMRLRPSAESPVVYKFDHETRVGVFCEETEGWYRIIYGNYRGYVSSEFVFWSSDEQRAGNILHDNTSVNAGTGAYGVPLATLNAGTGVSIIGTSGDFYEVETQDGVVGFVAIDNLELTKSQIATTMLRENMEGAEVKKMQQELRKRGFLLSSATGFYGEKTTDAVRLFQQKAGLAADGIAGQQTLEMLNDPDNGISITLAQRAGVTGEVEYSSWDKIKGVFSKGTYATVVDVKTGITYKTYRFGGWYHADCVPASKADTAKMKKMYGGSWSWNRRAIWVVVGGHVYAASQNGMPHLPDVNKEDDFPGHYCIHFKGCMVHETSAPCPRHQACVVAAYRAGH